MDADYDPRRDDHELNPTKTSKKKRSKFKQALERKKPVFDPGTCRLMMCYFHSKPGEISDVSTFGDGNLNTRNKVTGGHYV